MTREEIMQLDLDGIEARKAEIRTEIEQAADSAALDAIEAEKAIIEERVAQIRAEIETRKADMAAVIKGEGETIEKMEERKTMSNMEIRNSKEYIEAFAKYVKTGSDKECRALLTENISGNIPVPEFVEGIVAESLKASPIMSRVRRAYAKGNVKVGFELSAPLAEFHTEGGAAINEEALSLGIVTLVPKTLKKWVSISDEALDTMSGADYLRYIYEEITRKIIAAEEKAVIDAILAAPQTATATAPAVAKTGQAAGSPDDIINARALLTSEATDLVVILTPAAYAGYRTAALQGNFAFDVFDGCEVILNDYATAPIVGDLSGVMANYPNGDAVQFKYDDATLMTSDLVRILGRKPVAIEVVGNKYFAKISA